MSLKHDYLLNPVTALEYHHSQTGVLLILAGEGAFLKIFHAEESRLLHRLEVFDGQAVHGITVQDHVQHGLQVVIWGGSSLSLLTEHEFALILDQKVSSIANTMISASDWILDVAISPFDNSSCCFVTAHNTVVRASLGSSDHAPLLEQLHSPSRSILYSAHLAWESPSGLMVAAGTVFGEIVVWQCSPSSETTATDSRVLFTFTGHEGSIFGVNISPPIDGIGRLLASCSDDRTIRVWNLSTDSNYSRAGAPAAIVARETGFGESRIHDEISNRDSCIAMAMGHASRIWHVKFLGDGSTPVDCCAINILSFGEDSTTQQWDLDIGTRSQVPGTISLKSARLNQSHTFAFHNGKHIWSIALQRKDSSQFLLATGGADGKISQYGLSASKNLARVAASDAESSRMKNDSDDRNWSISWELDEILKSSGLPIYVQDLPPEPTGNSPHGDTMETLETSDGKPKKKAKPRKIPRDTFNRYAFVSEKEVLVTTTFGRVLLCHIDSSIHWEEVQLPESGSKDLRSYAVVLGLPELHLACLAGSNGNIYLYHPRQALLRLGKVDGKVADMFKVYDSRTDSWELLVTTLGGTTATAFSFLLSEPAPRIVENAVYILPDKFILTSVSRSNEILILGSRSGTLAMYTNTKPEAPLDVWKPTSSFSGDAITAIASLPTSVELDASRSKYFLTTSRDGFYSVFRTITSRDSNEAINSIVVKQIHQGTPPFAPLVEAGWFEDKNLLLYGFKGKNFVVWNETEQCEITNVECGGSHRSYAYAPGRGSQGGYYVYTKASKMYLHSHQDSSHKIIKSGGHGREIKACAISADHRVVATGAEDTAIRIWQYDSVSNSDIPLKCQAIIQKHSAGIQHLQWHGTGYLFSSGGNEEFFVWAVEPIPGFGIGVICEASCPDPSVERDLRIMNFDVTELSDSNSKVETKPHLLISLAYSDSIIRTYSYSRHESFKLVATARYTSSCLTQIRHLRVRDDELVIITAATDGRLVCWKGSFNDELPEPMQLAVISTQKVHQSAIKSLDLITSASHVLVATGGDDNALGISAYTVSKSMTEVPLCFILRSAHAAAITGLCFVPDALEGWKKEGIKIVSSGNDQKVKMWIVRMANNGGANNSVNIKGLGDMFTPVADVGDMASLGVDGKVLVVGNGMEVWSGLD